jgi:hypothetical protein
MATSIVVSADANGDLYEIFSDGTRKLKEAGYNDRVLGKDWWRNPNPITGPQTATTPPMTTTPATPALVSTIASISTAVATNTVKTATPDVILFDDEIVPIEIMTDLIFENIGGQELINIARGDIINGQKVTYQPIKNISDIERQYNPNNIIGIQKTSDTYFANFPIQIKDKTPNVGSGPNGEHVYFDSTTNDLVINLINIQSDEQVEIQIATDGTIYEAEL